MPRSTGLAQRASLRRPPVAFALVRGGKVKRLVQYLDREHALADLGLAPEAGSQHS